MWLLTSCLFLVFTCAILHSQIVAAQNNFVGTGQNRQNVPTPEQQAAEFRDIDNTMEILVDTLESIFANNQTKTFFETFFHELVGLTHNEDSLENLELINDALEDVENVIKDKETADIVIKAMVQLDTVLSNPVKHKQVKSLIDTAHKIVMDQRVKDIKEGTLGFLEDFMNDPMKKVAIGKLMVHALRIGQNVNSVNVVADSLAALNGVIMSPQIKSTILNQLGASANLARYGGFGYA